MLTTPDNLLYLHLLKGNIQNELFHHICREGEADWPVVPWSSFFLKTGVTLAFIQSSGTFPVLQDLSKMMESGSAMMSASSLSTHGYMPSGPMDLWVSSLLK